MDRNEESSGGGKSRSANETSVWKKEITFAAQEQDALVEAVPEALVVETPPEPVAAAPVVAEPLAAKPIAASSVEPSAAEPVASEPVAHEPVAPEPLVEAEVVVAPEPAAEATPPVAGAEPAAVQPEPVAAAPEPAVAQEPVAVEPEPVVTRPAATESTVTEPQPVVEPSPIDAPPASEVPQAQPVEAAPVDVPSSEASPVELPAPQIPAVASPVPELPTIELEPAEAPPTAAAPPVAPVPETSGDYGWLTDGLDDGATVSSAPAPAEPVAAQPVPAAPPSPVLDRDELDLEPEEDTDEKVPFWKKDLSLSRKPKSERPAKAPKEKRAKEKRAKKTDEPSRPFWKQDFSLSRKPKAAAAAATEAAEAAAPKVEQKPEQKSAPFWKRDLSLGKKGPKGAKAPNAQKAATAQGAKAQPFWKKDFSFGRSADAAKSAPIERGRRKSKKGKKDVVIGLKIGASQLAAARVVNNGSPELVQVAREPLEDGIIVGGELRDPETLAAELSAFFGRHKLPKRNVRLGIANNRIGVRTFEISGIDDPRQLANAIRFRAQETLPIPLEEAVLDWQVLSETHDDETGTSRRVLLVVAYRELVDRYVAACKKAGIRLAGIDLEAFAMLRAVIPPPPPGAPDPDGASVVVNVGHDRSTLAVSDGHICEFTRVLSWGGQSLSVAIARALDQTPSEVEPLKHGLVFGGTVPAPDGFSQEQTDAGSEAVSRELQAFARELVSSLRFYQNQPGSLGIGQIVLTGGTSHMPGLAAELERLIGVTVRVGDPLGRVKVGKRVKDPEQIGSFAVAVGLGIDD